MRLLYYSESYTPHDHRLLEALSTDGFKIIFVTQKEKSAFPEKRPFPQKVKWLPLKADNQQAPARLAAILRKNEIDLLLAGPLHNCAWDAARSDFHPWMAISWAYDLLHLAPAKKIYHSRIKAALQSADYLFCDAKTVLKEARTFRRFKPGSVLQVPWGISKISPFRNTRKKLRQSLGWEEAGVWICTRGWAPIYNPMMVLKAFGAASKIDESLRLVLAGGGVMQKQIQQFITERKLQNKIHCPGYLNQEQMIQWLKMSDFYVSAASCDGTSISMLEAMACELPVLLSDIPSNREWIKERKNGGLFPLGQIRGLTENILQMSSLPQAARNRIGRHNKALVSQRADWGRNRKKLTAACRTLARKGTP